MLNLLEVFGKALGTIKQKVWKVREECVFNFCNYAIIDENDRNGK